MTLGTALPRRRRARGRLARFPSIAVLLVLLLAGVVVGAIAYSGGGDETISGSGDPVTVTRATPPFTAVRLTGAAAVRVVAGPSRSVVVHADDNLVENVTTVVEAGTLDVSTTGSFTTQSPMYVDVTVAELDAVTLSGTGAIDVQGVDADALQVVLAEAGTGAVTVSGAVGRLNALLGGTGDLQLADLHARDADLTLSGTGRIEARVTGTLRATVSGDGSIVYSGNPEQVVDSVTGTGAVVASPDDGRR